MVTLAALLAGGLGALARLELAGMVQRRVIGDGPWGVLVVNLAGAAALGTVVGLFERGALGGGALTIAGTGFVGGFTTFSTWVVAGAVLLEEAAWKAAAMHLAGQLIVGVGLAAATMALG